MAQVTVNSNTYSDDGTSGRDMLNGGHRTWFFPLISDALSDFAASEAAVAAYADALISTSTTSIAIGTGAKSFTVAAGKQYAAGQWLKATDGADSSRWMFGSVTSYSGTTLELDVTDTSGSGTYADWTISLSGPKGATGETGAAPSATREAITEADTLVAADAGHIFECSGTFILSFASAASLGSGWWCRVRNVSTGLVTLDPDGSETIDGLASFVSYPGESRYVYCDGAELLSYVEQPFDYTLTTTATLTVPPGYRRICAFLLGGGAGGGRGQHTASTSASGGNGGGGGAYGAVAFAVSAGEAYGITVGAGGTGRAGSAVPDSAQDGTDGGATEISFDSDIFYRASGGDANGTANGGGYVPVATGFANEMMDLIPYQAAYIAGAAYGSGAGAGSIYGGAAGGKGGTGASTGGLAGNAGGVRGTTATGGGGAAGAADGGAGATADLAGGGGGGGGTGATSAGNGASGAAGCGGGGGGGYTADGGSGASGSGGSGGDGYARLLGVI